jgi:hypothetical protein
MAENKAGRKVEGALESNTAYYVTLAVMALIVVGIVGWWVTQ